MNIIGFTRLMKMIYGKQLPDLEKIQDMGLLAVKIAQHFALRVDFLDEQVCQHLSLLFRTTLPAKEENLKILLQERVDAEWFTNFKSIESKPFACASIGQVHRATLLTGEKVVIKIVKQEFRLQFLRDLQSLRRTLKITLFFAPKLKKDTGMW